MVINKNTKQSHLSSADYVFVHIFSQENIAAILASSRPRLLPERKDWPESGGEGGWGVGVGWWIALLSDLEDDWGRNTGTERIAKLAGHESPGKYKSSMNSTISQLS